MNNDDITDKCGAITMLKAVIQSIEKDMNDPKNAFLKGSYEILIDLFKKDYVSIQADIYRDFCGKIQNLARVNDDIVKEDEDD
jgi:hypothetical protein